MLAPAAPKKANQTYPAGLTMSATYIAVTIAKAAPAFTPKMPGAPNGLRVIPWVSAPATARQEPAANPRIVLGKRSSLTTI